MTTHSSGRRAGIVIELLFLVWVCFPVDANAQLQNLYPNFFDLAKPEVLDVAAFAGGFGSEKYGDIQEGLQLAQSITPYIGLIGRATGYQLWIGSSSDSALAPGAAGKGHHLRLNFARLLAGPQFVLYPGTTLSILGGNDVGDSTAPIIEVDASSWLFLHTRHPLNFAFSTNYNGQTYLKSSEIDLRAIVFSSETYLISAGGGGAIYGGGTINGAAGQGGPDLGIYLRKYAVGLALQGGYGNAGGFGQLSIIKQWSFLE
jgi:hypothetical protein